MIGSVKALARLAMVVATWVGLTSAALAANCDTLDSCYAAALSQGAAHVTIAEPDGADCLDRVGCAIIHVGRDVRILPLSKLGAHGLAHKTPFGAAALLPDRSLIVDALPWQVNPNGLTIVLRLLRRDNSGALPGAGAIFTASTNALGDASGAMLEFGVQDDGAFYIGRRNGWTLKDGQAPFYSFDLWEPDARRLPGDVLTVAVRLEPTGQTRVDAFAADGGRLTWDQGLLETGYPLKANSYPYKGDKLPVGANDNYALLAAIGLGPGVISHRAFGAMNKMSVFGAALSDDELVAVYNSEFKGLNDPPLSVGEHPCNTGAYLNFAGETTTTPCGALTAGLPRDEVSDGPHYIVLGDGAYARPDGDPRPDARIKLGAPEREPAALWTVRTTGFNQYVFRKGGLVLAQRPGSPFLVLREPSGSAWETFSVKSLGSGWTWANLASSQRFCARAEGAERYLAVCETNPSQAYAMNGPPAAPPNLRAFPSSESVVLTWDRPSTFPGRPLQYEIEVDGSRQLVNAPSARFGHLKADQELSIKVRAQLISGGTDPSPAAELKARTLPQPVTPGPEGFEYCAKDGGVCALPPGVYVVAYGAASRYSYRAVTGSVACDAGAFLPGAPQGLCFFAPWDQVRKGPPGAVYCGRKGDICAPPPGVGASVAYYGAYGRFLAVKITGGGSIRCEFFEGYVAEGRDDACFYGVASDKLECANGATPRGAICQMGSPAEPRLAYYGTSHWLISRPVTTAIRCDFAAFGLKREPAGAPRCWTGEATTLPPALPGLTFCAMEGQACPPADHRPMGYTRLTDANYSDVLASLTFVTPGRSDTCDNRSGYPGDKPGIGVCYRLTHGGALRSPPYHLCADDEGRGCSASRPQGSVVSYGIWDEWGWRVGVLRHREVRCSNGVFGDPAIGKDKKCWTTP